MITAPLRREGDRIADKLVARFIHQYGLRARGVHRYQATPNSRHHGPMADNVLTQRFRASRPHQVWIADITDIPTEKGCRYLASLEDLYTRKIGSWAVELSMPT